MADFIGVLYHLNKEGNDFIIKYNNMMRDEVKKIHIEGLEELFSYLSESSKEAIDYALVINEEKYKKWCNIRQLYIGSINDILDKVYDTVSEVFGEDYDWKPWVKLLYAYHVDDNDDEVNSFLEDDIYSIVAFGNWDVIYPVINVLYENMTLKD